MKVIFLDIDGVLNSQTSIMSNHKEYPNREVRWDNPHKTHIECLNQIIEATGAEVVISSTWRSSFTDLAMWRFLSVIGFRGKVLDNTPRFWCYRGGEIKAWLCKHRSSVNKEHGRCWYNHEHIESFVIIDDDGDMEDLTEYLVKTDGTFGLTKDHVHQAIHILNHGNFDRLKPVLLPYDINETEIKRPEPIYHEKPIIRKIRTRCKRRDK